MRLLPFTLLSLTLAASSLVVAQEPPQRRAQDQAAFLKARSITEPEERVAALKQFAQDYEGTPLAQRAALLELDTLLQTFPDRTADIHALAQADVQGTAPGFERWSEEARIADLLASAGPAGADLADAKPWAQDAVLSLTEESYRRQMTAMQAKYKLPPLTAKQLHHDFLKYRASALAALANVDLRAKDAEGADHALAEAYRLDPLSSEISSLRGQLALARHQDAEALEDFEHAEVLGDLKEPWRAEMLRLYAELEHGDEAGLNAKIDALYATMFPPAFSLPPRKLPAGGHTTLLELFTGSGCEPCVAPDLAVESLLSSYSRQDLVVLEYDEHIPRPDPLANPDSVARAATYRVGTTPEAFLDGDELPVVGASRSDVENVVVSFAEQIEDRAAVASPVKLQLTASRGSAGIISAQASVTALPLPATAPTSHSRGQDAPAASLPTHPIVRFALVEDHIRYSGENGIRFHRMVVRAMARGFGPDLTAATASSSAAPVEASFNPAELTSNQQKYLLGFATGNDRFGEVHFLTTQIPIQTDHLAVVAWVEDPQTRTVLQAAYIPVPAR